MMPNPWSTDPSLGRLPASFLYLCEALFQPAGLVVEKSEREQESGEYGAVKFMLDGKSALYRQAKHTPRKVGQFVTLWKRENQDSEISPFDRQDDVDWVIVAADEGDQFGVFIFSGPRLAEKGVFSRNLIGGKRAMRVYAPWANPTAAQAIRTQKWQTESFLRVSPENGLAFGELRKVLS